MMGLDTDLDDLALKVTLGISARASGRIDFDRTKEDIRTALREAEDYGKGQSPFRFPTEELERFKALVGEEAFTAMVRQWVLALSQVTHSFGTVLFAGALELARRTGTTDGNR